MIIYIYIYIVGWVAWCKWVAWVAWVAWVDEYIYIYTCIYKYT